jgi:hypothetical protein
MNLITTEDMIRFLYNEMTPDETLQMIAALTTNWKIKVQYEALKASMEELDSLIVAPRRQVIDRIMQYAEQEVAH